MAISLCWCKGIMALKELNIRIMKKNVFFLMLALLTTTMSFAQEWETDFDTAKQKAVAEGKEIIMVFQGSDWCAPCIRLDKEVWSTEAFQSYAADHYVMLQLDFPRRKKNRLSEAQQTHNNQLAEQYNTNGYFPYVVLLSEKGLVLGSFGYENLGPQAYIDLLNSAQASANE